MNNKKVNEPDPLLMQIIQGRFDSLIKEMAYKLIRSSYSSIIRESEDMGAAIFTLEGEELCESETTPMMMGTMVGFMNGLFKIIKERNIEVHEGDALIHNHPYHGASHASDIGVITPIFYKGKQIAWSATAAHHCDVGSYLPGLALTTPDIYGEARYFLGQKLYDRGKRCNDLWYLIGDNVRVPKEVLGDLEAQVGAAKVGEKRFCELVDDYRLDVVMDSGRALLDYSERLLRSQIDKVPDGVYEAEQYSDSDGKNLDEVLPIRVKVTIRGGEIEFDLTGSADQVTTARNVPFAGSTCTSLWFICKAIFADQATFKGFLPNNGGVFRPIKIHAPLGCIFNPRFPAACNDRFNQIDILVDSVIKALSPVLPLCAGTTCVALFPSYSGIHPKTGNYWVYLEVEEGAYGGSPFRDGMSAVDVLVANTQNSPIEHIEMEYPLRVNRYELNVDKTGAGKRRGGFAVIRNTEFLAPGMITALGDRAKQRPWGYDGGKEGYPQVLTKVKAKGERIVLPSACEAIPFDIGDSFELETASGGGYGNPLEREPELVLKDYLDELISERTVREEYGVVIRGKAIDEEATKQLRAKMSKASQ